MANKNEVTIKEENTALALSDYAEYEGAGFEQQDRADYSIPFINVLQGQSPEIETVDGAKPGCLINKITQTVYPQKEGLAFVPCFTQHVYVEWVPRDAGGGVVGVHALDSEVAASVRGQVGKAVLPNGNELIETFYVYGIAVDGDGSTTSAVISFTSSKIKKYKAWMTKARTIQIKLPNGCKITPPLFAHRYRLKTVKESNKHGDFWNFDISFDGTNAEACRLSPQDDLFQEAAHCRELIVSGESKADHSSEVASEASSAHSEEVGAASDDKTPF